MLTARKHTSYFFDVKHETLPVVVRKRRRVRNITLRYQPLAHALSLTLPWQATVKQGLAFIETRREWVLTQLSRRALVVPFADGQTIMLRGRPCRLVHAGGRGVVRLDGDCLIVPGQREFMARRVREWLIKRAREEILFRAHAKAGIIGGSIRKITLRDTRSLWGSCNRAGNLSFSWRLILAPESVLDYVVAHEVAHLKELNHGPRFWLLVEALCPHWRESRRWLKAHGSALHRYR